METTKKESKSIPQTFADMFAALGVKSSVIPFMVAQTAFETGNFKSKLFKDHNNATGIVFTGKTNQKNATKGRPLPEDGRYFYAKFNTLEDWAKDYVRILSMKSKPIEATNVDDFVVRLKANKYFSAPIEEYSKGVKTYLRKYANVKISAGTGGILLLLIGAAFFLLR